MRNPILLAAVVLCIAGCDRSSFVDSNSPSALVVDDQSEPLVFKLTDAATTQVRAAMASVPGGTHLIVFVDVDDEKYCTGFHYNLEIEANPSRSRYVMTESNGIKLAIEKDDVKFLNGTTLDYAKLSSGTEGFVFRNPNENVSLPDELRGEQQSEGRSP